MDPSAAPVTPIRGRLSAPACPHAGHRSSLALVVDGDDGRTYPRTIRLSIPADDALQEIGSARLAALAPQASTAPIVGPGEELPGLVAALPRAARRPLASTIRARRAGRLNPGCWRHGEAEARLKPGRPESPAGPGRGTGAHDCSIDEDISGDRNGRKDVPAAVLRGPPMTLRMLHCRYAGLAHNVSGQTATETRTAPEREVISDAFQAVAF